MNYGYLSALLASARLSGSQLYQQAFDLYNACQAWYEFEQNDATTSFLDSHKAHNLAVLNSETTAARSTASGKAGRAAVWPSATSNSSGAQLARADTALDGGAKSFTYGMWVYFNEMPTNDVTRVLAGRLGGTGAGQLAWFIQLRTLSGSQGFVFSGRNSADSATSTVIHTGGVPLATGRWYFVVLSYDYPLGVINAYVNNVKQTATLTGGTYPSTTANFAFNNGRLSDTTNWDTSRTVGCNNDSAFFVDRVLTDEEVAYLYATGNGKSYSLLAAEAGADEFYKNVVLHMHCDGANGLTTFVDESYVTTKTLSAQGNAQLSTADSKFGGSSMLCDGTGDWVQTTTGVSDFQFGTGDFTAECWFKTSSTNKVLLDYYGTGQANCWQLAINSSGNMVWTSNNGGGAVDDATTSGVTVADGNWHHVAVVRIGTTLRIYVDGVSYAGNVTNTRNYNSSGVTTFAIGAQVFSRNSTYDWNGYIDEVRITKGVGRYQAPFSVPAAAFPDRKFQWSKVSAWLNFDGTNGSTTFTDYAPTSKTYTASGANAVLATAQKFSGTASLNVTSTSYVSTPNHADFQFGAGDFTVEARIYPNAVPGAGTYQGVCGQRTSSSSMNWILLMNGDQSGKPVFEMSTSGASSTHQAAGPGPLTAGQWNHVAVTRVNGVLRVFVNGVSGTPVAVGTNAISTASQAFSIGQLSTGSLGNVLNGYIDNLRIIKGAGIYVDNFTPLAMA